MLGNNLLYVIVRDNLVNEFGKLKREWFMDEEVHTFSKTKKHLEKYGKLPSVSTLEKWATDKSFDELKDELVNRYISEKIAYELSPRISDLLAAGDTAGALSELQDFVVKNYIETESKLYSLKDLGEVFLDYVKGNKKRPISGVPTGWETLDSITDGWQGGDVNVIVARPKSGKSQLVFYSALKAMEKGYTPLIISMEMTTLQSAKRIIGMMSSIPMDMISQGRLSFHGENKVREIINGASGNFYFIEGQMRKNITEVISLIHSIEDVDIVFIDGGYLIKTAKRMMDKAWERMTEVIELIKTTAMKANIPIVITFQFNRQIGKRSADTAGIEFIHLSDAIGQVASLVLGIFDDDTYSHLKKVVILADRESKGGEFTINWDWERCDFSEHKREGIWNSEE